MKLRVTTTVLVLALVLSICSLAQERPVAVPGTADVGDISPQAERQMIKIVVVKVPLGTIFQMGTFDRDAEGNAVYHLHIDSHRERATCLASRRCRQVRGKSSDAQAAGSASSVPR